MHKTEYFQNAQKEFLLIFNNKPVKMTGDIYTSSVRQQRSREPELTFGGRGHWRLVLKIFNQDKLTLLQSLLLLVLAWRSAMKLQWPTGQEQAIGIFTEKRKKTHQ